MPARVRWVTLSGCLFKIWCQVYKVGNNDELYDALKGPYEAAGELEYLEVTPEIALDYYQSLWGPVSFRI